MRVRLKILFFSALLCVASAVSAQTVRVATAANLQGVIKALQADFKRETGVTVEPVIGSSGKLVAQISNGAPYDVFLSADMEFPQQLFDKGFSIAAPVVYARGCLVVCSRDKLNFNDWQKLLTTDKIQRIAIANPTIAPYGRAAEQALRSNRLMDKVKPKIVYGESIAQVDTYIVTGAVQLGFTSRSLAADPEATSSVVFKVIPASAYKPLNQGMVLLKHANKDGNETAAKQFYHYMLGPHAGAILKRYGYIIP